ncbi:MAG: type II toxin-antitoxin system death-on-curing family toxin [Candidatus Nanohaloarchaea archaeon]
MTWHPTVQDVLTAHEVVKENSRVRTSGFRQSQEKGLRKIREVLESARGEDDIYRAAAIYLKKLIEKHPFNDGNKRTAFLIANRFLSENGKGFAPRKIQEDEEIYQVLKWELKSTDVETLASWLETGELPDDR